MTQLVKVARGAGTVVAVLALVAAGAVLFVTVMMPFVFPLLLVGAGVATWRAARRRTPAGATPRDLPAANASGEREPVRSIAA